MLCLGLSQAQAQLPKKYRKWKIKGPVVTVPPSTTTPPGSTTVPAGTPTTPVVKVYGKIPYDPAWAFVQDYSFGRVAPFFDGKLDANFTVGAAAVSGLLVKPPITFSFPKAMQVELDSVKYGDGDGNGSTCQAWTRNVITGEKEPAFAFTGNSGNGVWVRNKFATPRRTNYYEFERTYPQPTEIEFWGWYVPYTKVPYTIAATPIQNQLGSVTYQWNYQKDSGGGMDGPKKAIARTARVHRTYVDYDLIARKDKDGKYYLGTYAFQPAATGGWQIDSVNKWQKEDGIINIFCLKNREPVPRYAEGYAQVAMRYGPDKTIDPAKSKVFRGPGYPANKPEIGLNTVHYYQLGNEPNRWWLGKVGLGNVWTAEGHTTLYDQVARGELPDSLISFQSGMMSPWEMAFTSKIVADSIRKYDPTAHIILGGLASNTPDYFRGIMQWCDIYNGGKAFFDGVAYHDYNNTAGSQNAGGGTHPGVAPENSLFGQHIAAMKQAIFDLVPDKEITLWITETGYSIQDPIKGDQENTAKTFYNPDGSVAQDRYITQGQWLLRSSLTAARMGLTGMMCYQLYDDSNFKYNPLGYMHWDLSCGIAYEGITAGDRALRPTTSFYAQVNNFGKDYVFTATRLDSPTGVIVDTYTKAGSQPMYIVIKPTETNTTVNFSLSLPGVNTVTRYTLNTTGTTATATDIPVSGGTLTVAATETPTFYIPKN
jgi:hypothetical protein